MDVDRPRWGPVSITLALAIAALAVLMVVAPRVWLYVLLAGVPLVIAASLVLLERRRRGGS